VRSPASLEEPKLQKHSSEPEGKSRQKKILIVDDDKAVGEILKRYLEKEGFEVLIATNGYSGISAAISEIPDVVVLDIRLGDVSGYTVLLKLAQMRIPTRVIMMTGHHRPGTGMTVASISSGACAYITKPYSHEEVIQKIKQSLTLAPTIEATIDNPILAIGSLMAEIDSLVDKVHELKGRTRETEIALREDLYEVKNRLHDRNNSLVMQLSIKDEEINVLEQEVRRLSDELDKIKNETSH